MGWLTNGRSALTGRQNLVLTFTHLHLSSPAHTCTFRHVHSLAHLSSHFYAVTRALTHWLQCLHCTYNIIDCLHHSALTRQCFALHLWRHLWCYWDNAPNWTHTNITALHDTFCTRDCIMIVLFVFFVLYKQRCFLFCKQRCIPLINRIITAWLITAWLSWLSRAVTSPQTCKPMSYRRTPCETSVLCVILK